MYEIFKEFTFEAAHHLAVNVSEGHPYARLHGHSFKVEVFLRGEPAKGKDWVYDFGEIERHIAEIRAQLDHNYLNEIDGLQVPTLENISRWIWYRLDDVLPGLDRVRVRRGSCGEGCMFSARGL
jgi:6-pyruvoyltetrahydropterin/6-carboxytetrahydropterin synthase